MEQVKLKVTDLKQFTYCPRIIYYTYCQPVRKKATFKMQHGQDEHEILEKLETRRTFKRYGLEDGERFFKVRLTSERLGLSGIMDMIIQTENEILPVEFKYTTKLPGLNHKYQLTAYTMLLEDQYCLPIHRGMIYLIPQSEIYSFNITQNMKDSVKKAVNEIRKIINEESFPDSTPFQERCTDCEYQNYCGDVF